MKVLLLPFDVASKGPITLDALNRIEGIEAKGIFVNGSDSRTARSQFAKHFEWVYFSKQPLKWIKLYFLKVYYVVKYILWADVIHWIWDSAFAGKWDMYLVKLLRKPGIIEWSGSDIRYPEKNYEFNPYAKILYTNDYEFKDIEDKTISMDRQKRFRDLGFTPLVSPEMDLYIDKKKFPVTFKTLHRLNVKDFKVGAIRNSKPLIVHSPTRRHTKGTKFVIQAIEALKKKYEFDFILIEGIPREKALELVAKCDIFIDQLLLGSNGMASCEAMSMSKSVICYIAKAVYDNGLPSECPIISATPDTIECEIEKLLKNQDLRESLGRQGREYAEKYLDVDKKALEIVSFYKEVYSRKVKEIK